MRRMLIMMMIMSMNEGRRKNGMNPMEGKRKEEKRGCMNGMEEEK